MTTEPIDALRTSTLRGLIARTSGSALLLSDIRELWRHPADRCWMAAGMCASVVFDAEYGTEYRDYLADTLSRTLGVAEVEIIREVLPALILDTDCDPSSKAWGLWAALLDRSAAEFEVALHTEQLTVDKHDKALAQVVFDACRDGWTSKHTERLNDPETRAGRAWLADVAVQLDVLSSLERVRAESAAGLQSSVGLTREVLRQMTIEARRVFLYIRDETASEVFRATPVLESDRATWTIRIPTDSPRQLTLVFDGLAVSRITLVPIGGGDIRLESAHGVFEQIAGKSTATLLASRAAAGPLPPQPRQTRFWDIQSHLTPRALELTISLGGELYGTC